MREPIGGEEEQLRVILRFLATGDAQITSATSYRISPTSIGRIIKETTTAIWDVLLDYGYISPPVSKAEWIKIAEEFDSQWNFPHCIDIDGKHVTIQAPSNTGSQYFNYKKSFSIMLMAVCDANYRFLLVDIGEAGRQSDGGVLSNSNLGYSITNKLLDFPEPSQIKMSDETYPHIFVGFPIKDNLLKPYSSATLNLERHIFNYRLSRARRTIENTLAY